jgi:toxin FitB
VIILDTNVIAELMKLQPHQAVFDWFAVQRAERLFTTSVNKAEVLYGIAALPQGRRRDDLAAAADAMFADELADRVLPFDEAAAVHFAQIVATRRRAGTPIEGFDAQIAATARLFGADVATRDVGGFTGCGVNVINPWTTS